MKLLIAILFSIGVTSASESNIATANYNADTSVYICDSGTAKKYHYKSGNVSKRVVFNFTTLTD